MSHDHDHTLPIIGAWPRWAVVPIGLALAGLAVLLGMVLEPAGYALAPGKIVPEPTIPAVGYGRDVSGGCRSCHTSQERLQASALDPDMAQQSLIDLSSSQALHGSLGCVACHKGDGQAEAKEEAHTGLIRDITRVHPEQCIICHGDLPDRFAEDDLLVPHTLVENKIAHGETATLFCSDCHGEVGHGFDPVTGEVACSMMVCVDCHAQQETCRLCHEQAGGDSSQMTGCDLCHEGPHDVSAYLACPCCHTSLSTWSEIDASSHPVELPGHHGETACFECHTWPNFQGLHYVCVDCHESGHTAWGDEDCTQCHDPGATWDIVAKTWDRHIEHWDMYKGDHLEVACEGCHFETYTDLDPSCDSCHDLPASHDPGYTKCWLCH